MNNLVEKTVAGIETWHDEERNGEVRPTSGWQNSTAKTGMVGTCFKDGQWTAASKGPMGREIKKWTASQVQRVLPTDASNIFLRAKAATAFSAS